MRFVKCEVIMRVGNSVSGHIKSPVDVAVLLFVHSANVPTRCTTAEPERESRSALLLLFSINPLAACAVDQKDFTVCKRRNVFSGFVLRATFKVDHCWALLGRSERVSTLDTEFD